MLPWVAASEAVRNDAGDDCKEWAMHRDSEINVICDNF